MTRQCRRPGVQAPGENPSAAFRVTVVPMPVSPVVRGVPCAHHVVMGEIINLRSVKKRLARTTQAIEAKQNRVRHGRDKAAKTNDQRTEGRRAALLDAARLDAVRRHEPGE